MAAVRKSMRPISWLAVPLRARVLLAALLAAATAALNQAGTAGLFCGLIAAGDLARVHTCSNGQIALVAVASLGYLPTAALGSETQPRSSR